VFLRFYDVTDLRKQDLLDTCFETVHCLIKIFGELELSLTNFHNFIEALDFIDVTYLGHLRLVRVQVYMYQHFYCTNLKILSINIYSIPKS